MGDVIRMPRPTSAAEYKERARSLHQMAVARKIAGDDAGFWEAMRFVQLMDELASAAQRHEENIVLQRWQRAREVASFDRVLERCREIRPREERGEAKP